MKKGLGNMYRRRHKIPRTISPEEKKFFHDIGEKYNVTIIPQFHMRTEVFIGMRRYINGEFLNKFRLANNYFIDHESIPRSLTVETVYEHIFDEMYRDLKHGDGLKERQIGGVTDWYR